MKVVPRGFPTPRKRAESWDAVVEAVSYIDGERIVEEPWTPCESVTAVAVFSRKSWVTAIPIEAKAREVRIQARNVRSVGMVRKHIV